MLKRYAHFFTVVVLVVALFNTSAHGVNEPISSDVQHVEACVAVTSGVCMTYAEAVKSCVAQLYARCKDYRELCGLGLALVCAYAAYKVSSNKKVEIAVDDFDVYVVDEKGHEAHV